jgi:short-subunit dehydrogenase
MMNKSILITGANGGIGKDTARQLALLESTEKVYLACRNEDKAKAAKKELEEVTGKSVFEIIIMDVSNIESVRTAVSGLKEPIDALIMNAGGMGGKNPQKKTNHPHSPIHLLRTNITKVIITCLQDYKELSLLQ